MKTTTELETQLRSWELRGPSAKLESRIFRPTAESPSLAIHHGFRWSMLAPSAAGLALVCLLATQWANPSFSPQTEDPMLAVLAIEHSAANHIAFVSGNRASRSLPLTGIGEPPVALAITGMIAFPLLRPTNP